MALGGLLKKALFSSQEKGKQFKTHNSLRLQVQIVIFSKTKNQQIFFPLRKTQSKTNIENLFYSEFKIFFLTLNTINKSIKLLSLCISPLDLSHIKLPKYPQGSKKLVLKFRP